MGRLGWRSVLIWMPRWDFRFQQFQHFHEDGFNVVGFPDGPGGADGLEELLQDNVQPRGFALRCFQQFLHVRPVLWRQLLCLPGQELEMEAYGIDGVAYFMSHSCGQ